MLPEDSVRLTGKEVADKSEYCQIRKESYGTISLRTTISNMFPASRPSTSAVGVDGFSSIGTKRQGLFLIGRRTFDGMLSGAF